MGGIGILWNKFKSSKNLCITSIMNDALPDPDMKFRRRFIFIQKSET